jgi:hypothetical protein
MMMFQRTLTGRSGETMSADVSKERCEFCLNFDPDDKQKHILKNLAAQNPGNQSYYEKIAGIVNGGAASSDMGVCYLTKERVNEADSCSEFLQDISKNY